jgi:anti-sigma B factor antagonist
MGSDLNFPQLTVACCEQDGAHVVALSGELDLRAAGDLEKALEQGAAAGRTCLDLTELQFIDSTGLATIIRAHQAMAAAGGALAVACRNEGSVRRTFETTGLTTLLTLAVDRDAAIHALG